MESTLWLCGVMVLLLSCSVTIGKKEEKNVMVMEKMILDEILNTTKYDLRVRPMKKGDESSPTEVSVNMYILKISRVDDSKMQYTLQMYLRQKWKDERLKFDDMGGKLTNINLFDDYVWSPDMFIPNEKAGYVHTLMKPNRFTRIYPDGRVLSSARVSFALSCPMTFQWFPFDSQICTIPLESFGFTSKDVILKWDSDNPVKLADSVTFAYYNIQKMESKSSPLVQLTSGNYSNLKLSFHLKRSLSYHVIHSFIPCTMLVLLSWITFWLDHKVITTRLFPVLSSLMVLVFKVSDINADLPIVPYVKSIDIWTGACLTFVFAALIELVIVDYRWRSVMKKQRRAAGLLGTADEENGSAFDMPLVESDDGSAFQTRTHPNDAGRLLNFYYRWKPKLPTGPKRLDVISRYLFPICFSSFFSFYFTVNLMYYAIE